MHSSGEKVKESLESLEKYDVRECGLESSGLRERLAAGNKPSGFTKGGDLA
jgi:hypothetical protein